MLRLLTVIMTLFGLGLTVAGPSLAAAATTAAPATVAVRVAAITQLHPEPGRETQFQRMLKGDPPIVSAVGHNGASAATADRSVVCAAYLDRSRVIDLTLMTSLGAYRIYKSGAVRVPADVARSGGWCNTTRPASDQCAFIFGDGEEVYGDVRKCR